MSRRLQIIPELLAPAGSLDAVRAALANGADAVYLGAERFNARDEGAQLSMAELAEATRLAHERGKRIYLTLNTLVKPHEIADALELLGDAIAYGVDAAIVQDLGLVRLIQRVYPGFEIHGSTQMTVHDASGAAVMRELGVERVVLARENTLDDIRAIRAAVPELGLETFVHGALCISYSGQCYMSGMISERSANRGSCAQSCRKDYHLTDDATGVELDRGYLISAKDLSAHEHVDALAEIGVGCLKIEGRKKKPEYVAIATGTYRGVLDRLAAGAPSVAGPVAVEPLVQIYSRGFTGGMYGGRAGRGYITRDQPDNRGRELGAVVARQGGEVVVEVSEAIAVGDGVAFEPPAGASGRTTGFLVTAVRSLGGGSGSTVVRQAIRTREAVPVAWRVLRTSHAALLEQARASFADLPARTRERRTRLDVRVFGGAGAPLKAVFAAGGEEVTVRSEIPLAPAQRRALDRTQLREQLGRLGDTPFALAALDDAGLASGLFLPVSELNHLRQQAVEQLVLRRDWALAAERAERRARIEAAAAEVAATPVAAMDAPFVLSVEVFRLEDAFTAADAGATEVVLDPFLRHPAPPRTRVANGAAELRSRGIAVRIRTPTIVRPEERRTIEPWLALDLPLVSGHLGLVAELGGGAGRDVVADYAVNCFNQHAAAELFRVGARRVVLSVELTIDEILAVASPWEGQGFDAFVFGRPEGMTIEHCVLSAAFDREPTTCRDLCVQKHPNVSLTDPAGYTFPLATDAACRNRLLHSRPVEGSEYLPRLWRGGIRGYRLVFNVAGDPIAEVVRSYRSALEALARGDRLPDLAVRAMLDGAFTRGHFARAV